MMITEPVIGSLANAFRDYTNLNTPGGEVASYNPETPEVDTSYYLPESLRLRIQVTNGLRHLGEALKFCHHGNLESITPKG